MTTTSALRPVGMLEKLYTARQVLDIYNSVIVTATYAVPSGLGDASLCSILYTAIAELIKRHSSLCCYIEGQDSSNPIFKRLDTIEIKEIIQITCLSKQESLAHKLQELHEQRWSTEQKPLWKLAVMKGPQIASDTSPKLHIAFIYHHAIGDGLSGIALHNALFLLKKVIQEYAPRWLIGGPSPLWAGLPVQPLEKCPFRSRIRLATIEADEVGILLQECKKRSVTLTSLLTAALVAALADALPGAPRFLGITPYSLRDMTGTSIEDMVNQVSGFETSYPANIPGPILKSSNASGRLDSIWDTAEYFYAQMRDELARSPRDNLVGLLPYVSDYIDFYRKKIGKAREASFEVSNLGVFTSQDAQPRQWVLKNMTFTQGAQPVGPAFAVNCVSVRGGPLTVAITWQNTVVDEDIIDAVARAFTDLPDLLQRERSK